ncbi:TRAP transporter substrate-binding protein [Roseovarius pelagicus]|uniref:TRAP transporter substrate-binding protein n=1 Tax=Roseovarius pelagicus TaxID=2980108 RepID=A0ABY6DAK4_9RHOB|nr:TRAP transporter substrate-binding protein [Roseovarius pelagicus]UXX83171.1 TRAP transporter substrate-binding protein [Roseovarius pelagicus]
MKLKKIFGGALTACVMSYSAYAEELTPRSLTYVGSWSGLLNFKAYENPFWKERIAKSSDGKWDVSITTFDQMGLNGSELFRMLSKGTFSVATTDVAYILSSAPELGGSNLPMLIADQEMAEDVMDVYRDTLDNILFERFAGAKLLGTSHFPQQGLFCRDELTGMSDLEGRKIRATGRSVAQFLDAIGAEGVTISFAEVPGALQRGTIDCAFTGTLSGYQAGWYEVADYLYPLPVAGWDFIITAMNGAEWEALSPEEQQWLLAEVRDHYEDQAWNGAADAYEDGITCLTGMGICEDGAAANMTLVEVTDEDVQAARKIAIEQILPKWASTVDAETVASWNETIGKVTGVNITEE